MSTCKDAASNSINWKQRHQRLGDSGVGKTGRRDGDAYSRVIAHEADLALLAQAARELLTEITRLT